MSCKVCKCCNVFKELFEFRERIRNNKTYYESLCKVCEREYNKKRLRKRYQENKSLYKEDYKKNRAKKLLYNKEYYFKNRERLLKYRKDRKEKDRQNLKQYNKNRRKIDPSFKLRSYISTAINKYLKINKASKNGESIFKYLNYTVKDLKVHLESLFEDWMSWNNHGRYDPEIWNDNDKNTWTWQIDHIIPQSELPYNSMEHSNFRKCWVLSNLRPLSSKQNIIDGTTKARHKNVF